MEILESFLVLCGAALVGLLVVYKCRRDELWIEKSMAPIFQERTSSDAEVRAICRVKENFVHEPAVAQIMNGVLSVFTLTGKTIQVPLGEVVVWKIRRKNILDHSYWWGKTLFCLKTPKTRGLVLGFSDPEPWYGIFNAK